ncbi:hypothetical protein Aduo_007989 [Ancylostoma duodenale]
MSNRAPPLTPRSGERRMLTAQTPSSSASVPLQTARKPSVTVVRRTSSHHRVPLAPRLDENHNVNVQLHHDHEFPIEREQEAAYADTLYSCVSNGRMDMYRAGSLLDELKNTNRFNYIVYQEFVESEMAANVQTFDYDELERSPLRDFSNLVQFMRISHFAARLRDDIRDARVNRMQRDFETKMGPDDCSVAHDTSSSVYQDNLVRKSWMLKGPSSFVTVRRKNDQPLQKITSLFRYIFMRITDPPKKIQEYSVRTNNRSANKDENLENLPHLVERTLLEFAEDMHGLSHALVKTSSAPEETESSRRTTTRGCALSRRSEIGAARSYTGRSLQKALRDVRAYQHEEDSTAKVFRWIPNDRKAKKHRVEGSGGGANGEEFIDVEEDDAYI